jgi:hypothetical protein
MESLGDKELREELERIPKMNPYERLRYIRGVVQFYKSIDDYSEVAVKGCYERLMLATKGY